MFTNTMLITHTHTHTKLETTYNYRVNWVTSASEVLHSVKAEVKTDLTLNEIMVWFHFCGGKVCLHMHREKWVHQIVHCDHLQELVGSLFICSFLLICIVSLFLMDMYYLWIQSNWFDFEIYIFRFIIWKICSLTPFQLKLLRFAFSYFLLVLCCRVVVDKW